MIKVNLLRDHRAAAAKPTSARRRSRMGLVLTAVFTLILFGLGTSGITWKAGQVTQGTARHTQGRE